MSPITGRAPDAVDPPFRVLPPVGEPAPLIVHVPHASTVIPDEVRREILLDDAALRRELVRMTDWHTDRLFDPLRSLGATLFANGRSRLVVDPERFADDDQEPMATVGQGVLYTRTTDGHRLRELDPTTRAARLARLYHPYHDALADLVTDQLERWDACTIIDGHSFASDPLPSEPDQRPGRPDICIGTDGFHTPAGLAETLLRVFAGEGYRVARDAPFSGAFVPARWYRVDRRVRAVLIEVRRGLYGDEATGEPGPGFDGVAGAILRAARTALSDPASTAAAAVPR